MKVADKVIVVTGGGDGIGRAVVQELLHRGARVAAVDLRREGLDGTVASARAGDRLATFVADITDRESVAALPDAVAAQMGPIDGVVNVAGIIQPFVPLAELDLATMQRVVDVNLWGTINVVQAVLPHLLDRPVAHIATVSSMGGYLPVPGQTLYGASKAAVKLLTEALWTELLDTSVGVSVIMPGAVQTGIMANSGVTMPGGPPDASDSKLPMTTPSDAARIIVDGIEHDRLHVYVGKDARLMGLLVRVAPKQAARLIHRQMKGLLGG
jgi:NAD(P)-dependent dehydrogenase (short-subunit alcohol dehydrogenase family)